MKKFLSFAMFGVMALSLAACGGNETAPVIAVTESILVETIAPETGTIIVMGEYIGTVEPNQQVAVLPRIPGEVLSVYFGVGDTVNAGDVLFTIDAEEVGNNIRALEAQLAVQDATVRAAQTGLELVDGSAMEGQILQATGGIAQAEAAVQQTEQNVEQARLGIEQAQLGIDHAQIAIGQAQLGIEQAQMGYDLAAQAYADTAVLFEAGIVARVVYDQAAAGLQSAAAGLQNAEAGLRNAEAGLQNAEAAVERAQSGYAIAMIAKSQAQQAHSQAVEGRQILMTAPGENRRRAQDGLSQAQAARNTIMVNINLARERLNDASVTAPIGGVIEMRNVEPFGFANPQAPAFIISDHESMTVSFRVPRNSFGHLRIGDEITLYDGADGHTGVITEIAATVAAGGLLEIRATIPNPPANLLGGTSVRIFAEAERADNVPILPLGVIHYDRGVPHVYVEENGFARRVRIETGIFDAQYVEVVYGISPGDRIISTWSARLADGVEVRES